MRCNSGAKSTSCWSRGRVGGRSFVPGHAHDIDGFTSVLAEDVVYQAPGGISGQGKAPCAQFFAGWWDTFPDAHVDVYAVHIAGDIAVEEGTFTGTHHGTLHSPAGDIAPTGRQVTVDYVHVLRYRHGKHASFNLLFDRLVMLEQLGLLPAPAPAGGRADARLRR